MYYKQGYWGVLSYGLGIRERLCCHYNHQKYIGIAYCTYCMYTMYMPDVRVYIREEDIAKWRSIEKKSAFIHDALNGKQVFAMHRDQTDKLIEEATTQLDKQEKFQKLKEEWSIEPTEVKYEPFD